jgi:hypothetical protein
MPEVEVRASRIEGLGVFACRSLRAGERIRHVNLVLEITAEAPIRQDLGESVDHCSYPDGKVFLWGSPDRHVNHSCDPNAWLLYDSDALPYFVARHDIAAGDEVTWAIPSTPEKAGLACNCGSARCRRVIEGGFFGLPGELRQEYRPFLAEWFVRRNRERLMDAGLALVAQGVAAWQMGVSGGQGLP